jgi:hypothetical protein
VIAAPQQASFTQHEAVRAVRKKVSHNWQIKRVELSGLTTDDRYTDGLFVLKHRRKAVTRTYRVLALGSIRVWREDGWK